MYNYLPIVITGAINTAVFATNKLIATTFEKKRFVAVIISPITTEDDKISVYVNGTDITHGGVPHDAIDEDSHMLPFDITLDKEGDEVIVQNTSGAAARNVTGSYVYEIIGTT
jgi:hypothetical protein